MPIIILMIAVFAVFFIVQKIYDKQWSKNLSASVKFNEDATYENEKTQLVEVITNDKVLPIPILDIDFNLNKNFRFANAANSAVSDKLYRRDVFSIGSKKKITRYLDLICLKRGYYTLDKVNLTAHDLFLKGKYHMSFDSNDELYVYPERISSERINIPFSQIMGEVLSRQKMLEDPFEFGGIRDYMITDPMKYINWKASAKAGGLVVNQHDTTITQKITIILDTNHTVSALEDYLTEESIRLLAALTERVINQGISLNIVGNSQDIISDEYLRLYDLKGTDMEFLRKTFARLVWNDEITIDKVLDNMKPSENELYVLITKNTEEEIIKAFENLAGRNSALMIIPYRDDIPKVESKKFRVVPWKAASGNKL